MKLQDYEQLHLECLRELLPACTVLLKTNGDFPLPAACPIALYGSGVRWTVKGGTGSGEVNSRFSETIESGMEKAGFTVTSKPWLDGYDTVREKAKVDFIKEIKRRAKEKHTMAVFEGMGAVMPEPEYELPLTADAEVAVYVLSRISGEGNDRRVVPGDVLLTQTERRDILALAGAYKKFMLVLNVGGPVDLTGLEAVGNILVLSQLGAQCGTALADILLGKSSPSGKLTTTWAAYEDYPSFAQFGEQDDTCYNEGVYVGYRYFDSAGKQPLYPFGYGLSYTTFALCEQKVTVEGESVAVSVSVQNTGSHTGSEVAQLYVSVPGGELDQPWQMLAGWAKTAALCPGESETVTIRFQLRELASYHTAKAAYVLEGGDYILRLGTSSRDTAVCGVVRLLGGAVVRQVRSALGTPDLNEWHPESAVPAALPDDAPVFAVEPACIHCEAVKYDREWAVDPAAAALADEQLALLAIGAHDPRGGIQSMIGSASTTVAGAAGETAHIKGIPPIVMADGPAGLRLSPQYFVDEKGAHGLGQSMPASITDFLPKAATLFMGLFAAKPKKGAEIREQYATAIPIGTAIAQSWDLSLAQRCGDLVGDEMERFQVQLWLAPALNIHRSILCGRNFEYFSEDPLISGRFAAAITRGVQAHAGRGCTVKHFAANNQETNRYNNNSVVSERAMREIYLKGFEICVRESQPKALMTSYNLLNGQHTSERRDLIEDILRCEFGYEGIVMTDWVVAGLTMSGKPKYAGPTSAGVALAGGELYMPGDAKDYACLIAALREGKVSRRQLEISATRLLRLAGK